MKKIVFLSIGVILVVVILSLQSFLGAAGSLKRIFLEITHDVEDSVIEICLCIKSFVTIV